MSLPLQGNLDSRRLGGRELAPALGGKVHLRGLLARDRPLHTAHLLRLTPEDRRARFHSVLGDKAIIAYSSSFDWQNSWVFGAFVCGTLRGAGELVPLGNGTEAELSISVEQDYQHIGIGKQLMLALILVARRIGLQKLHIIYTPDNQRMRTLARSLGARHEPSWDLVDDIVTIAEKRPSADAMTT